MPNRPLLICGLTLVLLSAACGPPGSAGSNKVDSDDDRVEALEATGAGDAIRSCESHASRSCPRRSEETSCPSGRFAADDRFDGDGVCLPARPRGTPADSCPSGRRLASGTFTRDGLCLPENPRRPESGCPEGWRRQPGFVDSEGGEEVPPSHDQFEVCQPPAPPPHDSCSDDQRPGLGSENCVAFDTECPPGDLRWHREATLRERYPEFTGEIHYVQPDGSGGDGTRRDPFGTVGRAIEEASNRDIVALSAGKYRTTVGVKRSIALVGACPSRTVIDGVESDAVGAVIDVDRARRVRIANLEVTGPHPGVQVSPHVRDAAIAHLRIEDVEERGLRTRADTSVEDVVVHGVRPNEIRKGVAPGIVVGTRGRLDLRNSVVSETVGSGISADAGRTNPVELEMSGLVVRGVGAPENTSNRPAAIRLGDYSEAELRRSRIAGTRGVGIRVTGSHTSASLETTVVRGRGEADAERLEPGVVVEAEASLEAQYLLVDGARTAGVVAFSAERLELRDTTIRRTRASGGDAKRGHGIFARGARVHLRRVAIADSRRAGILADRRSEVEGSDLTVDSTEPGGQNAGWGQGVVASTEATVSIDRTLLSRNHSAGLFASGGASLEGRDLAILRTRAGAGAPSRGAGLVAAGGSTVGLERMLVDRNRRYGIGADGDGTRMEASDLVVRRTGTVEGVDRPAHGLAVLTPASLAVRRSRLIDNDGIGAAAIGEASRLALRDVGVTETEAAPSTSFGVGLLVQSGARAETLRRIALRKTEGIGLLALGNSKPGVVRNAVLAGTTAADGHFGDGLFLQGSNPAELRTTLIHDNERAGVVAAESGARLVDTVVTDNGLGLGRRGVSGFEARRTDVVENGRRRRHCSNDCFGRPKPPSKLSDTSNL